MQNNMYIIRHIPAIIACMIHKMMPLSVLFMVNSHVIGSQWDPSDLVTQLLMKEKLNCGTLKINSSGCRGGLTIISAILKGTGADNSSFEADTQKSPPWLKRHHAFH